MSKVTTLRSRQIQQAAQPAHALPRYELRLRHRAASDDELEIWQLPAPATPHIKAPVYVAGLRGRNLALIEHQLLQRLKRLGVSLAGLPLGDTRRFHVDEDTAINIGLLFRALAPMRNRDHMLAVAEGIGQMAREEAAYWLGMAMHRKHPRRVLMALRFLLIDPHR